MSCKPFEHSRTLGQTAKVERVCGLNSFNLWYCSVFFYDEQLQSYLRMAGSKFIWITLCKQTRRV